MQFKLYSKHSSVPVARPDESAAWRARHERNLVLLLTDSTELYVGTSLIFVPSGKVDDDESYHTESFDHSMCRA